MLKRTLLCVGLVVVCLLLALPDARADFQYKVKPGDTLSKIAKKYGLKPQDIRQANEMQGSALQRNQVLTIPEKASQKTSKGVRGTKHAKTEEKKSEKATETYRVKKGDTVHSIALMLDCSEKKIRKMNRLKGNTLKVGRKLIVPARPRQPIETEPEDSLAEEGAPDEVVQAELKEELKKEDPGTSIGKWNSAEERNLFIRVVKTFLGVPYRYGGSSLRGIDCSAFVKRVYEIVDISLPRTAREQSLSGKWVNKGQLEEGDLVFFRTRRVNDHVGIYIGNNQFVHLSSKNREAKIDNLDEPYFFKRFIRGVRVKELQSNGNPPARAALNS
jgi:peptidoglycan DL-endopeptidase LytE